MRIGERRFDMLNLGSYITTQVGGKPLSPTVTWLM